MKTKIKKAVEARLNHYSYHLNYSDLDSNVIQQAFRDVTGEILNEVIKCAVKLNKVKPALDDVSNDE